MNKVLCLLGPTASGKTALALQLAQHLPCDLISVDSTMVYRGLNIGSAKPAATILNAYPHALIDICDPSVAYSVAQFRQDAAQCIAQSIARQRLPLLVGGSMLYHRVLQQGIAALPPADPTVRAEWQNKAAICGWPALHQQLQQIDPMAANRIHPQDAQRILRALEVYTLSGKTLSWHWQAQQASALPYTFINIGLDIDREILRQKISVRFEHMLQQGLITEVSNFYSQPEMHANLPSMKSLGYQQIWQYLAGKLNLEQMRQQTIDATRQFAKRQITWLRSWPTLHWISISNPHIIAEIVALVLSMKSESQQ